MPTLTTGPAGASEAQRAIRASKAIRARRDFGLAAGEGNVAAFWAWRAWERKDGPQRRGLEPLTVAEDVWRAALVTLELEALWDV